MVEIVFWNMLRRRRLLHMWVDGNNSSDPDCICNVWMLSASSKPNGIWSKLCFGYSSPRATVPWYPLMSFHSALCYYVNYWRFVLMAHTVVTTWCRNCINSISPFTVCKCTVSISPLPIEKLSLYSLYFILISCSSSCGVEFGRTQCRKLQKLQISVLKLKRNTFLENRLLENWLMILHKRDSAPVILTTLVKWFLPFVGDISS